jgi:hypothetical protein
LREQISSYAHQQEESITRAYLSLAGDRPYRKISNLFLNEWIEWIESKLDQKQRHRAASLLAQIEGEVLIKLLRNP